MRAANAARFCVKTERKAENLCRKHYYLIFVSFFTIIDIIQWTCQ